MPLYELKEVTSSHTIGISHIKARKASRRCFPIILHFLFIYWNSSSLLPAIILVNPIKVKQIFFDDVTYVILSWNYELHC